MKPRKSKEITAVLQKKGFELNPQKHDHEFYYLLINGKKQRIFTFFSHGKKEYDNSLLSQIKKQLKFDSNDNFENFLDCPFSYDDYLNMLSKNKII